MTSQIIITIKTDRKDTTINITMDSAVPIYSSDLHKKAVEVLYKKIDKLIEGATG